jgi:hypothetical protein
MARSIVPERHRCGPWGELVAPPRTDWPAKGFPVYPWLAEGF